jgi:hypothetical protein
LYPLPKHRALDGLDVLFGSGRSFNVNVESVRGIEQEHAFQKRAREEI